MKTMNLMMVCVLALSLAGAGTLRAQQNDKYADQKMRLRAEWMALEMASKLDLNENQVKQLTEANLSWLQQSAQTAPEFRGPGRPGDAGRMRPHRQPAPRWGCCGGPQMDAPCAPGQGEAACTEADCTCDNPEGRAPLTQEEVDKKREERKQALEKQREARQAYDQSLQQILTEEQYQAYKKRR